MLYCVYHPSQTRCPQLSQCGSLQKSYTIVASFIDLTYTILSNEFLLSAISPSTMSFEVPSYPNCIRVRYVSQFVLHSRLFLNSTKIRLSALVTIAFFVPSCFRTHVAFVVVVRSVPRLVRSVPRLSHMKNILSTFPSSFAF